ncbi:MAG: SGNH/GDSL hydrolase family protein [Acidobacteriota bacterium]
MHVKRAVISLGALALLLIPIAAPAQINFDKTGYYLALGDSVSAGEGALPVTHGFVYQLYDRGVFGPMQRMDFGNIAIKGVTADEVELLQVPQALCIQPPRIAVAPSVITLTAGANDFFVFLANGIPPDPLNTIPVVADNIAARVEGIIRSLVFGMPGLPAYCTQGIPGIRVLVANYYSFNHPDPQIEMLLDLALRTFSESLQARIAQIEVDIAQSGKDARVGLVDTFSAMDGREGLLLIERRLGFSGALEFEIHPTNAGHSVIAAEFTKVWRNMQ